jgi:hypothetical protein
VIFTTNHQQQPEQNESKTKQTIWQRLCVLIQPPKEGDAALQIANLAEAMLAEAARQ